MGTRKRKSEDYLQQFLPAPHAHQRKTAEGLHVSHTEENGWEKKRGGPLDRTVLYHTCFSVFFPASLVSFTSCRDCRCDAPRIQDEGRSMGDRQSSRRATIREFCRLFCHEVQERPLLCEMQYVQYCVSPVSTTQPPRLLLIGAVWMNGRCSPPPTPRDILSLPKHAYMHMGCICRVEVLSSLHPQIQMKRRRGAGGGGQAYPHGSMGVSDGGGALAGRRRSLDHVLQGSTAFLWERRR